MLGTPSLSNSSLNILQKKRKRELKLADIIIKVAGKKGRQ